MPVRLDAKQVKKIARLVEIHGGDRSTVMRRVIDSGLDSTWAILSLRKPGTKGRGAVGRVIRVVAAEQQAKAAEMAAQRATGPDQVTAEIKAHRAREHASALKMAEVDRLALAETRRAFTTAPTEANAKAAATHRPRRHRQQHLTEAEIKAAADRAQARSENRD
jgi:hypothetical protein